MTSIWTAQGAAAHGLDLGDQVVGGAVVAQPERDVGAGVGQRQGDRPAEAARGARDEGDLPARARSSGSSGTDPPSSRRRLVAARLNAEAYR